MKQFDYNGTGTTQVVKYKPKKSKKKIDYIIRAYGTSIEDMRMIISPTSSVEYRFKNFLQVLLEIIESQDKQLDYSGYYISFLLGQISKKEFEEISDNFVIKEKKIPEDLLQYKIYIVQNLMRGDITPKEMAQYFQCNEKDVIQSLKLLTA